MVEVRDKLPTAAKQHTDMKHPHWNRHKSSSKTEQSSPDDPILAVVTVPLSSVNIEDDEDKVLPSDGEESTSLTPWKYRKGKSHDYNRDETSSTNITLPLRMVGCSSTSFGSISLKITVKASRQSGTTATTSSSQPNKSQSENGTAEESIEIGALARIMQSWAIYDGTATDDDNSKTRSPRNKKRTPQPRIHKKWNRKTKRWNKLKLNAHGNSRDSNLDQANWFTFMKWSDEK